MCGIVGLFAKDAALYPRLGALLTDMLITMTDRGPDSAGFAVYSDSRPGQVKITLRADRSIDLSALIAGLPALKGLKPTITQRNTHVVVSVPEAREAAVYADLAQHPDVTVVSSGKSMEVYKEVGLPKDVASRFGLSEMQGTHGIGHTRMATESAVTTNGAHPFTTGPDECLVHNGSLSNHNSIRRELMREGLKFKTENDTEVAAAFMSWRMQCGASMKEAMASSLNVLDGFYTFVMGTESGFGVLRDPIACKPAVMAETDRWVAFGTEYRALVNLPGIDEARVWEPTPATVYFWGRQ